MMPRLRVTSSVVLMLAILRTWFSLSLPLRYSAYFTSLPAPVKSAKPPAISSSPPVSPSLTMKLNCAVGVVAQCHRVLLVTQSRQLRRASAVH